MQIADIFTLALVQTTIRSATPIILAALAAVISKQAAVVNLGIEGMMLFGAYFGFVAGNLTQSWFVGVIVGVTAGAATGVIMAAAHLRFKAHILVVGFAINMLALALTRFLLQQTFGISGALLLPNPVSIPAVNIAVLEGVPILASIFSGYNIVEIFALVLVFAVWFVLFRTTTGLRLRSVGLHETVATTAGLNVEKTRFAAIVVSGVFAGLAGVHLSMGYSTMFVEGMTGGRGFMGLAAMNFGGAHPIFALCGALIFGFTDAVALRLQMFGFPSQLLLTLPYLVTVLVLSVAMIRAVKREKMLLLRQSIDDLKARN